MRAMPTSVVCPNCWSWSELGQRTTCKRCAAQLMFSDGRRVDEVAALTGVLPGSPIAEGAYAAAAPGWMKQQVLVAPVRQGVDWVGVARWVVIGYGLLTVAGLLLFGLVFQHISVTVLNPRTGAYTSETLNIGAVAVLVAAVAGAIFGLMAWLTQFTIARVIFLMLDAIAVVGTLTQVGTLLQPGGIGIVELGTLAMNVIWGGALAMSIFASAPRAN